MENDSGEVFRTFFLSPSNRKTVGKKNGASTNCFLNKLLLFSLDYSEISTLDADGLILLGNVISKSFDLFNNWLFVKVYRLKTIEVVFVSLQSRFQRFVIILNRILMEFQEVKHQKFSI